MSWHKTTFPSTTEIDPDVVNIGKLAVEAFERANKPQGFAMFHAKRGIPNQPDALLFVYLTPVASELCTEILEKYPFEPCEAPFTNDQDMAYVLGDPWSMSLLQVTQFPLQPMAEDEEQTEETQTEEAQSAQAAS